MTDKEELIKAFETIKNYCKPLSTSGNCEECPFVWTCKTSLECGLWAFMYELSEDLRCVTN